MNPSEQRASRLRPGGFLEFLSIAAPLIISNGALSLHHFVDRLFLSWYGQDEIAASLPAGILAYTILSLFLNISSYTNTFVAQYYGAEDYRNVGKAAWQGIHFSILATAAAFLVFPFGLLIIQHSGHKPDIIALEQIYFQFFYYGMFFFIVNGALSSFYSGRGKTVMIMLITVFSVILNIVLDYMMIFGKWGFPEWGMKGAAIATVISNVAITLIYFACFLSPKNNRLFQTRSMYALDGEILKRLFRFGVPSGIQGFLSIASFTVFVFLIGTVGEVELAASNIVIAINTLSFMPVVGAGLAASTMVGQYIGRHDYPTAERSAYTAIIAIEILMIAISFIYFFFPEPLMRIFEGNPINGETAYREITRYGADLLLFVAVYQIFDALLITFAGALRGAGDTLFAMWAEVIFAWCFFVPGTWVILFILDGGVIFAWFWASLYIMGIGLTFFFRFRSGYWKTIHVIPE